MRHLITNGIQTALKLLNAELFYDLPSIYCLDANVTVAAVIMRLCQIQEDIHKMSAVVASSGAPQSIHQCQIGVILIFSTFVDVVLVNLYSYFILLRGMRANTAFGT